MKEENKGWRKVNDVMPKAGEYVVCYAPTFIKPVFVAVAKRGYFYHLECNVYVKEEVTHWMPLPDAPKNTDDDEQR